MNQGLCLFKFTKQKLESFKHISPRSEGLVDASRPPTGLTISLRDLDNNVKVVKHTLKGSENCPVVVAKEALLLKAGWQLGISLALPRFWQKSLRLDNEFVVEWLQLK
ncbi:hypothetical protein BFJ69_g16963 [Fusarium oxysporum]|uniref:Uncharacterized protein n=1 Tax=Fusarium oxysporum TaxID=5507 RepID=A0A420M9N3_FUSOX|nr:hypothetical protein BFJ69_g16963 [Fusarium oxysporum]